MLSEKLYEITDTAHFVIDLMYAVSENMTKCPVYERIGFGNRALVRFELWEKLQKIIPFLDEHQLKLKIRDAYRPPLAHEMLHDIVPIKGFFAPNCERSLHCHAAAIDCCLCKQNGEELSYPTKIDAYEAKYADELMEGKEENFQKHLQKARHDYQDDNMKQEISNREQLRELMESVGLEPIMHEWWHYNLPQGRELPIVEWKKD